MKRETRKCRTIKTVLVLVLAILPWRYIMAETSVFQPSPLEGMKEVPVSEASKELDAEVTAFFRGRFSIESADYYLVPGEIPWIAVSKFVQNQMKEKSIRRTQFDWYEPGIHFVEVYLQDNDRAAFAVAMPEGTNSRTEKLIGFYVLCAASK